MLKFLNSRVGGAISVIVILVVSLTLWTLYRENVLMKDTGITIGYALKNHRQNRHGGPSVTVGYTVGGADYKSSIHCSDLIVDWLAKGTPFEVEYSLGSPMVSNVNYEKRISTGDDVISEAWITDLYDDGSGIVEVIYSYTIDSINSFTGADFIETESIIRRGDRYEVVYSKSKPHISKLVKLVMQSMDGVNLDSLAYYDSLRMISPTDFRK